MSYNVYFNILKIPPNELKRVITEKRLGEKKRMEIVGDFIKGIHLAVVIALRITDDQIRFGIYGEYQELTGVIFSVDTLEIALQVEEALKNLNDKEIKWKVTTKTETIETDIRDRYGKTIEDYDKNGYTLCDLDDID